MMCILNYKTEKRKLEMGLTDKNSKRVVVSKISLASSALILLMLFGLVVMVVLKKSLPGMKED